MKRPASRIAVLITIACLGNIALADENGPRDYSPSPDKHQLPFEMHSRMSELPSLEVGSNSGDIQGNDNRALQAAVDYIAALGGGTVVIGPGEYQMNDSLHLRPNVIVRGSGEQTVLRKAHGTTVSLGLDGDFGEQQITLGESADFQVGDGVAVWDNAAGGFHTTVARITGRNGNTYSIDKPLMADCMVSRNAKAATIFPVVSGYDIVGAEIHDLVIDGNKEHNDYLNGCRGAGIFLYRGFGTIIENCIVKNYNGDGISFQQSNDVLVTRCVSEGNSQLGLHPGSGSQRPRVLNCVARNNGTDGLFLCWRVRHGVFEENLLEGNGRFGISIGHKDTDNLLRRNVVRGNDENGVCFRNESLGMAAHRNRLVENTIENNGKKPGTAAIRVRGATNDLVIRDNTIRDTREQADRTQTVGVVLEAEVGNIDLHQNKIEAQQHIQDQRKSNADIQ